MSAAQNIYSEINRIAHKKKSSESNLQELRERKEQKLLECDRKKIEVIQEYLSGTDPILNSIRKDSNQLLQLENTAMGSITPLNDSLTELRAYLEQKFNSVDEKFITLDEKFTERFNALDGKLNALDRKVNVLDGKFNVLDGKFNVLDGKFNALDGKVNALDGRFAKQNSQIYRLQNIILNKDGENVVTVPFLDGTSPQDHGLS